MAYILVNHECKLIMAFSPKCGCQTLRWWFLRSAGVEEVPAGAPVKGMLLAPDQLDDYPDYLKIQFLRDPLERLVSFYAHWVVRDNRSWCFADEQRRFPLHEKSFRQFLYVLEHLDSHELAFQHHLVPQLAHGRSRVFDRILLLEHLDAELDALGHELGLDIKLRSFNHTHYQSEPAELAADRNPTWLRHHGVPRATWFYDESLATLAHALFQEDSEAYRLAGGLPTA